MEGYGICMICRVGCGMVWYGIIFSMIWWGLIRYGRQLCIGGYAWVW